MWVCGCNTPYYERAIGEPCSNPRWVPDRRRTKARGYGELVKRVGVSPQRDRREYARRRHRVIRGRPPRCRWPTAEEQRVLALAIIEAVARDYGVTLERMCTSASRDRGAFQSGVLPVTRARYTAMAACINADVTGEMVSQVMGCSRGLVSRAIREMAHG